MLLSNEAYDCQKVVICCSVVDVRRLIFVIKAKDWILNTTYSFKVAFCSYYQSAFHVLLLLTLGITIIT